MKILIVNDDGIQAEGLRRLTEAATHFGEVRVMAPASQCSAMSQRITLRKPMQIRKVSYPVGPRGAHPDREVPAWSLDGTPADCVKAALWMFGPEDRPDVIFSGMNFGWNIGHDIAYSGTVSAALEGIMNGVPSVAFSNYFGDEYGTSEEWMIPVMGSILHSLGLWDPSAEDADRTEAVRKIRGFVTEHAASLVPARANQVWNVNFPGIPAAECRGVLWERSICQVPPFRGNYLEEEREDGTRYLTEAGIRCWDSDSGSDMDAVFHNYVSVGKVTCSVMQLPQ